MTEKPLLLDLFCGAGGCSVGYAHAGFDIVGVDNRPQKHYPFPFVQMDALEALMYLMGGGKLFPDPPEGGIYGLEDFAAIHASPPCQRYSSLSRCRPDNKHPDLLAPTRGLLIATGKPWMIENVVGAPCRDPITLCGLMFGLKVFRHRYFESNYLLLSPSHPEHGKRRIGRDGMVCVVGHGSVNRANRTRTPADHRNKASWVRGMGIDWMTRNEMCQAIPPAFTFWVGSRLREAIE